MKKNKINNNKRKNKLISNNNNQKKMVKDNKKKQMKINYQNQIKKGKNKGKQSHIKQIQYFYLLDFVSLLQFYKDIFY